MALTCLVITAFHNIEASDLALELGYNFLIGANSSKKISGLEAGVYLRS